MDPSSITMINNVLKLKGKLQDYPKFVEDNLEKYRTLRDFINNRLQMLDMEKGEFARSMGISHQDLNNWEVKGIPQYEKAIQLGIALKLNFEELNDFLWKYTNFRQISSEQEIRTLDGSDVSKHAGTYLDQYVEGSRFQKHYSRKEEYKENVWEFDLILKEQRDYYKDIYNKLGKAKKEELIKLGLILRMKRKELDEFLSVAGYYPLSAKNLYEGALILVLAYMEMMFPEQFDIFTDHYRPLDFKIVLNELLSRCVKNIPKEMQVLYKKYPKWYAPREKMVLRKKQRDAAIILDVEKHIFNTWLVLKGDAEQSEELLCSVETHVRNMLETVGFVRLDSQKDEVTIQILQEIDRIWAQCRKKQKILEMTAGEFQNMYTEWLTDLKKAYSRKYGARGSEREG